MKILEINSFNNGSTGKIMLSIAEIARMKGYDVKVCVPKRRDNLRKRISNQILIGNLVSRNVHLFLGRVTGLNGCFSIISTFLFIKKIERYKPDIIHLHNLHNSYINIPLLFKYLKKEKIPVIWTLHDCWAFTGRCPHFLSLQCYKWKSGCGNCKYPKDAYPRSNIDTTNLIWKLKHKWFTGLENVVLITPSIWLSKYVKMSFLQEYEAIVINNGVDQSVFHPRLSEFRKQNGILKNDFIVLGVSYAWNYKKGLDVFAALTEYLPLEYKIVLVGVDTSIKGRLPDRIISIERTDDQIQLAEIYSAANVFVNPTREDTFPTTNIEALSCGTPVITSNYGGGPEIVDENCGVIVDGTDIKEWVDAIINTCEHNTFKEEDCLIRACRYNANDKFIEYTNVYEKMLK